ncbi:rho-related GTP-binding protein RhoD [Pelecanus crispus]|uniref:rho-related GTP-binding protein RhoD n=1 Tax=Pelecanus crispus TaxID=36300 RepID=UPI003F5D3E52
MAGGSSAGSTCPRVRVGHAPSFGLSLPRSSQMRRTGVSASSEDPSSLSVLQVQLLFGAFLQDHGGERDGPGPAEAEVKAVVVGDGGCGKTSLLVAFARGDFPKAYVPTVFEKYTASLQAGGKHVKIHLWDTAGQEDYDRLRPLSYSDTNVVLICFDVTSPNSYDNILTKWYPEVNHFCKGVPVLLVGCKTDLRQDRAVLRKLREGRLEPVSYQQGEAMARQLHAVSYLECSARYQENVEDIFVEACRAAFSAARRSQRRRRRPRRGCVLC